MEPLSFPKLQVHPSAQARLCASKLQFVWYPLQTPV
jgi:hypothetical protein